MGIASKDRSLWNSIASITGEADLKGRLLENRGAESEISKLEDHCDLDEGLEEEAIVT